MRKIFMFLLFNGFISIALLAQDTDWFQLDLDAAEPREQIEYFTKSIEQGKELSAAYFSRASAYLCLGEVQRAIDDYSKCIDIDSNDAAAFVSRGKAKQQIGVNFQEAIADIVKAQELANKNSISIVLYNGFDPKNEDCHGVIAFYDKILKQFPDQPSVCNKLGYCYLAMGNDSLALENFNKTIALQPDRTDAYLGLTLLYYYKNDLVSAKKYFDQAKALNHNLQKGLEGFETYKMEGFICSDRDNEVLKTIFTKWE